MIQVKAKDYDGYPEVQNGEVEDDGTFQSTVRILAFAGGDVLAESVGRYSTLQEANAANAAWAENAIAQFKKEA